MADDQSGSKVMILMGGPNDGHRHVLDFPDWPLTWRMPANPSQSVGILDPELVIDQVTFPTYEITNSRNSLGDRIYRYAGDQP